MICAHDFEFQRLTPAEIDFEALDQFEGRLFSQRMRRRYDFIVLDAPPVLAVKDVQILTRLADATLFVIKWQATKEDAVRAALRMLGHQQATIAGAVLTQVDHKRHAKGLYGDSVQYIQKYGSYYSDKAA